LVAGKIPEASVQRIRAKTTSQLQLTPIRIPKIRPSSKEVVTRSTLTPGLELAA
jgi:hypothetical protein